MKRLFFATFAEDGTAVRWHSAKGAAFGLPPNAFLDLGHGPETTWVLVACKGRGCRIVAEGTDWQSGLDALGPPSDSRSRPEWRVARDEALGERLKALRTREEARYRAWRAQVDVCVATSGFFDGIPD